MKYLPAFFTAGSAMIFLLIGIAGFAIPIEFLSTFGLPAEGPAGVSEIRAQYGGFFIAFSIFLIYCFFRREYYTALLLHTLVLLGLNLGRLLSLIVDGFNTFAGYTQFHQIWTIVVDPGGLIIGLLGLWIIKKLKNSSTTHVTT